MPDRVRFLMALIECVIVCSVFKKKYDIKNNSNVMFGRTQGARHYPIMLNDTLTQINNTIFNQQIH